MAVVYRAYQFGLWYWGIHNVYTGQSQGVPMRSMIEMISIRYKAWYKVTR
jgi:hypothetical protein